MSYWLNLTLFKMGFWLTWALIPILVEIIPSFISSIKIMIRNHHRPVLTMPAKMPMISIIVPVYNSEDTLFACIESIHDSTYPIRDIQVILADNHSTDDSFTVFTHAQETFSDLNLSLIHTDQGKAEALNTALYSAIGTYIINIDSDGVLEKHALMNMILKFENDFEMAAMTGTILTQRKLLAKHSTLLQRNEYFEYAQAFLSGRTIETQNNELFTMSGAFSAFRKEAIFNTFLYDISTIGEDTDMTFQIRDRLKRKVGLCDNAIFYIDPIENFSKLYTQRQRWQRGEVEVIHQYAHDLTVKDFFRNFMVRRLLIDHTFLFPRMIWLFASIVLLFFRYSPIMMGMSYVVIYLLYILVELLNYLCVLQLLQDFPDERKFYRKQLWVAITFPFYNFICAWIRLVGILNSMTLSSSWNSLPIGDEFKKLFAVFKSDFGRKKK
ncbi:TIGR03111 family XrtG-associated glycosyltransferase [Levilactobacillus tujiorum]|uniref:TIGR03111 family XrtG-associated glycosyltransferase n=1 Tax=Levilactobacillus tujiorum TaxID=2912243 RepID=UPI00145772C0|nr:TIGR03111 family XrtG-associated glycosyltransferase [Levilactobacillus tujiorum]NLR31567.1 putative glycosyltransferase, exosortase G system-associated [Levilactobacillus tujiorum]